MPVKAYVLGFAFTADGERLVLLKKQSPEWQRGKLNGVGGKIEAGETPLACMVREFAEETGVTTNPDAWIYFAELTSGTFHVHAYCLFDDAVVAAAHTVEEHEVTVVPNDWNAIKATAISNLSWLIPAAIDAGLQSVTGERLQILKATYAAE